MHKRGNIQVLLSSIVDESLSFFPLFQSFVLHEADFKEFEEVV